MGFASPATDYVERQLSPSVLCNIGAESRVLETDVGFAVIEPATPNFYGLCLFDECFAVYGSPAQVALAGERQPTLISVRWHNSRLYAHGWEAWCAQAGEDWMEGQPVIRQYDEEHYALQAAIAGQGLVLASSIL
ncbi:hypothetical protein RVM25_36630, partial [Enterobacter hormaechei subsp. xiangfangensis]